MLNTFFIFLVSALITCLYIAANFWLAVWVINRPWKRLRRIFRIKQHRAARYLASPQIFRVSVLISVSAFIGIFELKFTTSFWSISAIVLLLGLVPFVACIPIIDRFAIKIEPKSSIVKWGIAALFSVLLIWLFKALVSSELNDIFPIGAEAMPVALSAGVFLSVFGFLALIVMSALIPMELVVLFWIFWID